MKKTTSLLLVLVFIIGLIPGGAKAKLVACVGNSNTYGFGLDPQNTYPAQLERILRQFDPKWETRNFGVNGATVLRDGDIPYVNQVAYNQALASEPDVVIFCFGANASRTENRGLIQESYISDYISLIDAFSKLPSKPKMWIFYPLKIIGYTSLDVIVRNQIIPLIAEVAYTKSIPLIDLYSVFEDLPHLYQGDGVHPTVEGAKLMAEMVAATILGMRWVPDFNGDSTVNIEDLINLIDKWGQSEPALDIAPPPFGDGIVDVQDLEVVMRYWGQDVNDPTFIAHWRLDDSEGDIAQDSAGNNDAVTFGGPLWQPTGGMVNGAIQLDGVDDCLIIGSIPNPTEGPFSVLAWIKGGASGQVVLSQIGVANWLLADTPDGNLMTELKGIGRGAAILPSQTVITDGNWHRIGLVWDGSQRTLYVDDVAVAQDAQPDLEASDNGLYIGTGKAMEPVSFWSGLIDDVRIYNRPVRP